MKAIRAIPTQYNGYTFRSRLEARWAVYLDSQYIKWEYEKEGYDLGSLGWYLPDFWFPQVDMWGEVKGKKFTQKEILKCEALHEVTGYPCLFLQGMPDFYVYYATDHSDYLVGDHHGYCFDEHRFYSNCGGNYSKYPDPCDVSDGMKAMFSEHAIINARSARFEHGEKPRV